MKIYKISQNFINIPSPEDDSWMDKPDPDPDPQENVLKNANRWRIAIELTWDLDPEDIIPKHPGDKVSDYGMRALYKMKPYLNQILDNTPFKHYHILELPKPVVEFD